MTRFPTLCTLLLLCVMASPAVLAQVAPQAPSGEPPSPLDQPVFSALQKYREGDAKGALAILEPHRAEAAGQVPVLSLLGALYVDAGRAKDALDVLAPLAQVEDADPAILYNAGRAALALGKADDAFGFLVRAVSLDPASPASRELGLLLARRGQVVEAYRLLRPWAIRSPRDGEARLTASILALQLERPFEAEQLLVGQPKADPAIRLLLAKVAVLKGDGPAALALLEPLATHPESMDLELRRTRAEAYLLADAPAEAIVQLRGKTGSVPSLALLLARAERQTKDPARALETLRPFADKLPDDPKQLPDPRPAAAIAIEYGQLLIDRGQAAQGLAFLERATRLNALSPEAFRAYGRALEAGGKAAEAAPVLLRAKELDDGRERSRAEAAEAARQFREALAIADAASRTAAPKAGAPLSEDLQEAFRAMASGDRKTALEAARRRLKMAPDDLVAHSIMVQLLLAEGRHSDALGAADAALAQAPKNPDVVYQRGAVLMALKRTAEAEQAFRRALELAPNHTAAMSDLAVLLMNEKKWTEAESLLRRVLAINPRDGNAAANLDQLTKEKGKG